MGGVCGVRVCWLCSGCYTCVGCITIYVVIECCPMFICGLLTSVYGCMCGVFVVYAGCARVV